MCTCSDQKVGKTCMIQSDMLGGLGLDLPSEYQSELAGSRGGCDLLNRSVEGKTYPTYLVDTNEKIHPTPNYTQPPLVGSVDVYLLCFSLTDRISFDNVRSRWREVASSMGTPDSLFFSGLKKR